MAIKHNVPGTPGSSALVNQGMVVSYSDFTDLKDTTITGLPSDPLFRNPETGFYSHKSGSPIVIDDDLFHNSNNSGHFEKSLMGGDLSPILMADFITEIIQTTTTLTIPATSSNSSSQVLNHPLPQVREGDFVIMNYKGSNNGFVIQKTTSKNKLLDIVFFNSSSSAWSALSQEFDVLVVCIDRLPSVNKNSNDFYRKLQNHSAYGSAEIEADLSDLVKENDFRKMLSSRRLRVDILLNSDIKSNIQGSAKANNIMIEFEGAGY